MRTRSLAWRFFPVGSVLLAILAGLLAAPAVAVAQRADAALSLQVVDWDTGEPVEGARVRVVGHPAGAVTNAAGQVRLAGIRPGPAVVEISRIGYDAQELNVNLDVGETLATTIRMSPRAVEVEGVTATARRAAVWTRRLEERGFYARQRTGQGTFMTAEEIERFHPKRTVDIFHRTRGFTVIADRRGKLRVVSTRGEGLGGRCQPHVFMDGMKMERSVVGDDLDFVSPEHILAVEAYTGPSTIPAEYNMTGSACGVLLIWTR